jgi:hypothetical protein
VIFGLSPVPMPIASAQQHAKPPNGGPWKIPRLPITTWLQILTFVGVVVVGVAGWVRAKDTTDLRQAEQISATQRQIESLSALLHEHMIENQRLHSDADRRMDGLVRTSDLDAALKLITARLDAQQAQLREIRAHQPWLPPATPRDDEHKD